MAKGIKSGTGKNNRRRDPARLIDTGHFAIKPCQIETKRRFIRLANALEVSKEEFLSKCLDLYERQEKGQK